MKILEAPLTEQLLHIVIIGGIIGCLLGGTSWAMKTHKRVEAEKLQMVRGF